MTPLELKEARLKLGLSQEKLAIKLGVHRFTLQRWESGEHKVPRMLDLALKELKREQRRLKARRRQANRRNRVKSQCETARTKNGAVARSKSRPARVIFMARGEMGARGMEFSSASVALVVPQAKLNRKQEVNNISPSSIEPSGETDDSNKITH